jgi:hypothetical protein
LDVANIPDLSLEQFNQQAPDSKYLKHESETVFDGYRRIRPKGSVGEISPFHLSTPFLSEEKAQSCDIAWLRQLSAILSTSLLEP